MRGFELPTTAEKLGLLLGAPLIGEGLAPVESLVALKDLGAGSLAFFSDKKYAGILEKLPGGVVLTESALVREGLPLTFLVVENPKRVFAELAKKLVPESPWQGVHPQALVSPGAKIAPHAVIGPGAVVSSGASVGNHSVIYPGAYLGPDVHVGEHCEIHPRVVLLTRVTIGNRVKIFSGAVLGSEGFGFLEEGASYVEMPQLGSVKIEDDVRIGALCTVDRGTLGETRIGKGSKLDDHVHVGHNVVIGKNCILCGQVALAGSCELEDGVILGGQVGVAGHLTIGKGARVGAQTGVGTDLKAGETYWMTPAAKMEDAIRMVKQTRRLPKMAERLKKLEEKIYANETRTNSD